MKATGVVRRIDDLGRIVIPKEIRKNFKINEGDSLEIFVDSNGVVLKKYSLLDDVFLLSAKLVDSAYSIYGRNILVTDKETVIAASKNYQSYLNKELTHHVKENIERRSELSFHEGFSIVLDHTIQDDCYLVPLLVNSETVGSIIMVGNHLIEEDKKLALFIASILIKNVES